MGQTVNLLAYAFGGSNPSLPTKKIAEVAQLIEHQPSKLRVASLSLVFRSEKRGYIVSMYPLFFISFLSIKISAMQQSLNYSPPPLPCPVALRGVLLCKI